MATIDELAGEGRPLTRVRRPAGKLGAGRGLYVTQAFVSWMKNDLPRIKSTTWGGLVPVTDQVRDLFERFMAGLALSYNEEFNDLSPTSEGVWELKTGDVRIFGWFPSFDQFVATNGADANWLKEDAGPRYGLHIERCSLFRGGLDLDPPKHLPSQDPRHVISF